MLTQKSLFKENGCQRSEPMSSTKLAAFRKEFPWIWKRTNGLGQVGRVYVSRIEPTIINSCPYKVDIGDVEATYARELIWLLDAAGEPVTANVEEIVYRRKYIFWGEKIPRTKKWRINGLVDEYMTIEKVLSGLGEKANSVQFLLSYFEYTNIAIVYKAPKGVSVPEWNRQQIEAERANIQAACAEIDTELTKLAQN